VIVAKRDRYGMTTETDINIIQHSDAAIGIEGELNQTNAAVFEQQIAALKINADVVALDLIEFDVGDGIAIATAINAIRHLLTQTKKLKLIAAPQILCHNIYRVGLLESGARIELVAMREDEPYA
jgi:ABC-type transporter Mla MlaB component